ncbi:MAG: gamma-glutamyl-gamma-aminobutyrate hydrolase family protein [Clostridia bacterium]
MKQVGETLKVLSGMEFMTKRYYEVNAKFLEEHPEITGIILGGCNSNWDDIYFDIYEGEMEMIREAKVPILGICAGHHLMAIAYGGGVRRADFGHEERFFTEMQVVKKSLLTEGLSENPYVFEYHYCAVYELPENCELLMASPKTKIQSFKVKGENKFGVQFHPELDVEAFDPMFKASDPNRANGNAILKNFLSICE